MNTPKARRLLLLAATLLIAASLARAQDLTQDLTQERTTRTMDTIDLIRGIEWLGHDTFRITSQAGAVIYTDPFQIEGAPAPGSIILITHSHRDHCSAEDVARVQSSGTVILATADCKEKLSGDARAMAPGDAMDVKGIHIEAVPAYNTNKKFHPRENGWVGYIFTVDGRRIYLAGDTDRIPEMKGYRADVALLPVSGTYVMTAEEAAGAALDIAPSLAIPMHYASIVGTTEDALAFERALLGKIPVHVFK